MYDFFIGLAAISFIVSVPCLVVWIITLIDYKAPPYSSYVFGIPLLVFLIVGLLSLNITKHYNLIGYVVVPTITMNEDGIKHQFYLYQNRMHRYDDLGQSELPVALQVLGHGYFGQHIVNKPIFLKDKNAKIIVPETN